MHELTCHERCSTLPKPGRREAPVHQRAARSVDVPRRLTLGMTPSDPRSMRTKLRGAKPVHHEQETSGRSTKHVNTINELRNSYCPHGLKGIPCIPASGGSTSSNDFNHVSQSATIRVTHCVISNTPSRIVVREPAVAKSYTQ